MNRQFPALTGLAIVLVVMNHAITLTLQSAAQVGARPALLVERLILVPLRELGTLAVPVFLFVTGAYLVYAFRGKDLRSAYRVVWARLKGILAPYLLWSLVFYVMVFFTQKASFSPLGILKNLAVGYPFNFVPLLVFFYLISPLLFRAAERWPWVVAAVMALYQAYMLVVLRQEQLGLDLPAWMRLLTPPVLRTTLAVWGIFFPLSIVYGLYTARFTSFLDKAWPFLAGLSLVVYVLGVMNTMGIVSFPVTDALLPATAILLTTRIRRDSIPFTAFFERAGKRSYGLYLTHLTIIYLALYAIRVLFPALLDLRLLVAPLVFCLGFFIPTLLMTAAERTPAGRVAFRYVFG